MSERTDRRNTGVTSEQPTEEARADPVEALVEQVEAGQEALVEQVDEGQEADVGQVDERFQIGRAHV